MSKVLLIDFENVQGVNLSQIEKMDCKVAVFTGSLQSKVPIDLVTSAQRLGGRLEWIRIDGTGPNALDFHIAYVLGSMISEDPGDEYYILSRDRGFDPLIRHILKGKTYCKRIASVSEIGPVKRVRDAKEVREAREPRLPRESRETREPRESRESREPKAESGRKHRDTDDHYTRVLANLKKIDKGRRPRNRKTLKQH
ncbi:MAG: PIN domain-containing protein, partial [bacterium]|nr:PIN domain-containing protein [bacterium]